MKHMNIETLMDILDWFDDGLYDYLIHILLTKLDGKARIRRAMPELRKYARSLVAAHRGTDRAYPEASKSACLSAPDRTRPPDDGPWHRPKRSQIGSVAGAAQLPNLRTEESL